MLSHSGKINKHCQCPKGMAQQGTENVKQTLPYPGNAAQARSKKNKGYKEKGNPNICSREKAKRDRERKMLPLREARTPNLLNIALCGVVSSCLHPYP